MGCACSTSAAAAAAVSLLAAELTEPRGQVVAIDQSNTAIKAATQCARGENVSNIRFRMSALDDFGDSDRFGMVLGRYVLIHHPDAAEFLKKAARFVRPDGRIAFHEVDMTSVLLSSPTIELRDALGHDLLARLQKACPESGVAGNMVPAFVSTGLGIPDMFCEIPISGWNTPLPELLINTLQRLSNDAERTHFEDGSEIRF